MNGQIRRSLNTRQTNWNEICKQIQTGRQITIDCVKLQVEWQTKVFMRQTKSEQGRQTGKQ